MGKKLTESSGDLFKGLNDKLRRTAEKIIQFALNRSHLRQML